MTDLRKFAAGKPCMIRVPGVCNFNSETTVGCHVRIIGISGIGLKSPDILIAWGCSDCHAVVDGQRKCANFTKEELRLMLLEGMARTLVMLVREDVLQW